MRSPRAVLGRTFWQGAAFMTGSQQPSHRQYCIQSGCESVLHVPNRLDAEFETFSAVVAGDHPQYFWSCPYENLSEYMPLLICCFHALCNKVRTVSCASVVAMATAQPQSSAPPKLKLLLPRLVATASHD